MRWTIRAIGALAVTGVSVLAISGCLGQSDPGANVVVQDSMEQTALKEVGSLYKLYTDESGRPPRRLGDFARYAAGMSFGFDFLSRGDLVAFWGANLTDAPSDTVLAYEKKTPKEGGSVLMLDGTTVKSMTAEEFHAAPKAGSEAASAKAKR